jgi:hypothetical protein
VSLAQSLEFFFAKERIWFVSMEVTAALLLYLFAMTIPFLPFQGIPRLDIPAKFVHLASFIVDTGGRLTTHHPIQ